MALTTILGSDMISMTIKLVNNTITLVKRGTIVMEKDEILKRSREQKEDEGVTFAQNKGRRYGIVGFGCVFIVIALFNLFKGQDNFVPFAMFWAYAGAEALGQYSVTKKKSFLISTIAAAIAVVCFLACYILKILGI